MHYFKVTASNGLCGCDDEWLVETEEEDLVFGDILEAYAYESGYAGMENDDDLWGSENEEDGEYDLYYEAIAENSVWDEISEEEFIKLRDEEGWDVR